MQILKPKIFFISIHQYAKYFRSSRSFILQLKRLSFVENNMLKRNLFILMLSLNISTTHKIKLAPKILVDSLAVVVVVAFYSFQCSRNISFKNYLDQFFHMKILHTCVKLIFSLDEFFTFNRNSRMRLFFCWLLNSKLRMFTQELIM